MTDISRTSWTPAFGVDLYIKLALASGLFVAGLMIPYLWASSLPFDASGHVIGRDFLNTWMGALAALAGDPSRWFPDEAYNAAIQVLFGANYPEHYWSYPPHLLLFTWPLGLLPYFLAYAVWCAIGLVLYMAAAANGERRLDRLALLALAPAVTVNIVVGQNGFFTAALLIAGLLNLDRRPILSGIFFGLLTIKPQLGFLLPLMLLLTGRWRVIFAAAATVVVLVTLTALVFGWQVWGAYLEVSMPIQARNMMYSTGLGPAMMPTAFLNMRLAGFPLGTAFAVHAVVAVPAIAAVIWAFWRRRDPVLSLAFLVTATFVASPYVLNYDMVVFGWVLATLIGRSDNDGWDYVLMLAVWTLPFTTVALGLNGITISSLALIAFAARLVWKLWQSDPAREGYASRGLVPAGPATA